MKLLLMIMMFSSLCATEYVYDPEVLRTFLQELAHPHYFNAFKSDVEKFKEQNPTVSFTERLDSAVESIKKASVMAEKSEKLRNIWNEQLLYGTAQNGYTNAIGENWGDTAYPGVYFIYQIAASECYSGYQHAQDIRRDLISFDETFSEDKAADKCGRELNKKLGLAAQSSLVVWKEFIDESIVDAYKAIAEHENRVVEWHLKMSMGVPTSVPCFFTKKDNLDTFAKSIKCLFASIDKSIEQHKHKL